MAVLLDFGLAAKVRPALVLGCDIADEDRVVVAVGYHTTALRNFPCCRGFHGARACAEWGRGQSRHEARVGSHR